MTRKNTSSQHQSQLARTLQWLAENYELSPGVCLPRCVLYTHYTQFCRTHALAPAAAATFGKIIRQRFPKLTTRRLGTRGQSKYHYYGLGIRETSPYYHAVYAGRGLTRFSRTNVRTEAGGGGRKHSMSGKAGTVLPDLPGAGHVSLPQGADSGKVATLLLMYRTHCQRVLDTAIAANFSEIQSFLLHFWQGMPEHLVPVLEHQVVLDLLVYYDSVLYKVLLDVLVPPAIQEMPETLTTELKVFARCFPAWLETALEDAPEALRAEKRRVASSFVRLLTRQLLFIQLATTARGQVLGQREVCARVCGELAARVDPAVLAADLAGRAGPLTDGTIVLQYLQQLQRLLEKQEAVEGYTEWLEAMMDTHVIQKSAGDPARFRLLSADFLLRWNSAAALIMKQLTLAGAQTFGACHVVSLMLAEYLGLIVDSWRHRQDAGLTRRSLVRHLQPGVRLPPADSAGAQPQTHRYNEPKGSKGTEVTDAMDESSNDSRADGQALASPSKSSSSRSSASSGGDSRAGCHDTSLLPPCGHAQSLTDVQHTPRQAPHKPPCTSTQETFAQASGCVVSNNANTEMRVHCGQSGQLYGYRERHNATIGMSHYDRRASVERTQCFQQQRHPHALQYNPYLQQEGQHRAVINDMQSKHESQYFQTVPAQQSNAFHPDTCGDLTSFTDESIRIQEYHRKHTHAFTQCNRNAYVDYPQSAYFNPPVYPNQGKCRLYDSYALQHHPQAYPGHYANVHMYHSRFPGLACDMMNHGSSDGHGAKQYVPQSMFP